MAENWDGADKEAMKVLGEKAKLQKWPSAIDKAVTGVEKAYGEFDKVRQELKKKLVADQDAVEKFKDALSQFQDEVEGANFGLDPRIRMIRKRSMRQEKSYQQNYSNIWTLGMVTLSISRNSTSTW